ncbi:rod shape-determining protein MreC [Arenimonas sp.]|uniref:rod shape-determining protein MreC n=1 Tax=Arenimonas sp. TaxID=1872635 RepID=UPI002D1F9C22|nr:rod shape-determining protein MreC [Arenimonas sp.]
MAFAGKSTSRLSESAATTLPIMAYMALAICLMVADHRGGYGEQIRHRATWITEPMWWLASAPTRTYNASREGLALRGQLQDENAHLHRELEISSARLNRLSAVAEENQRLRQLLGGTRGYRLNVQLAGVFDVDLDPYRQRLVLDAGSDTGVQVGQALIDSGGVLGQVVEVGAHRSTALLLTDPDHAVPVQVARTGLRAIAYGTGRSDRLDLPNIPQSADIRTGDLLVTSGIGGRFPAGFPVGTVTELHPDATRLFVVAEAQPAAHFERGLEVLLISNLPVVTDIGPPAPKHAQNPAIVPASQIPASTASAQKPATQVSPTQKPTTQKPAAREPAATSEKKP